YRWRWRRSRSNALNRRTPIDVVKPLVKKLRAECDLIVVLTHQGPTAPMQTDDEADPSVFRGNDANLALAGAVTGIDAVLGGHTDAGTRDPLIHPDTKTVVMQTFGQGQHLGLLEFEITGDEASFVGGSLQTVNADALAPDPKVAERLAAYRAAHPDLYEIVGELDGSLTRRYYAESTMGNAFADIVAKAAGTTIGLMPSGALRRDIEGGPVRRVDLLDAFPFEDRVARVQMKGETLLAVLEQGLSLERGFLQVSGLDVTFDLDLPVGSRVKKVLVGDTPLDRDAIYSVATLEIMAQGGDQYTQFNDAKSVDWIDGSFAEHLLAAFASGKASLAPSTD
ncbi:MAG: 5'-nucleotidase C-terminal domain-containing protein, partial [Pseudomonadota bacterium]